MTGKAKDNGADDFQARLAKEGNNPAGWLRVMLEWMQAREVADEKRQQADEKRWQADAERWQAWEKQNREWEKKSREQEQKLDRIGERIGGWGNSEGDIFEMECAAALQEKSELAGVHFDEVLSHLRNNYEYDIVGVNKTATMAIEVKRTLRAEDVLHFADKRLPRFAELFPGYAKGRKISGAVIFRRAPLEKMPDGTTADPIAIALQKGIIAVQATGKNKLQPVSDLDKVRR